MTIILGDTFAYQSNQFSVLQHSHKVVLVAEASDLRYQGPRRIYDDACDVGIAIRSSRTGRIVRYYLSPAVLCIRGPDNLTPQSDLSS